MPTANQDSSVRRLITLVMALFFAFGFCTVLVDTLIPKLKALFALSYAEVMLTQFCFFGAYFVVSIPAARLLTRVGYLQSVTAGLVIMAVGCLLFTPAASAGVYPGFLAALFLLATGVTIVQVAANPLATSVGDPARAHSRLTLAQAFNSLATTVGPIFGATFILSGTLAAPDPAVLSAAQLAAIRQQEASVVQAPFLFIAGGLLLLAVVCWLLRHWAPDVHPEHAGSTSDAGLWRRPRLAMGALSIFVYVGAEVSIGSMMVNYLMQPSTLGASPKLAGTLVSVYWGLAMVGRFAGSSILRRANPGVVLTLCAAGAATLAIVSGMSAGALAAGTLLAVGLCNSIMFPTIFALAVEGLTPAQAPKASGLLCLAIVGGAVVPVLTGVVADHAGLGLALLVPVACYIWIGTFGQLSRQRLTLAADAATTQAPA